MRFLAILFCLISLASSTMQLSGNCTGQGTHVMEMSLEGLSLDEAAFLAAYHTGVENVSEVSYGGLVTFRNGTQIQLMECNGSTTWRVVA